MPSRRIHLLRAVAIAYPFATWLFACGLIVRTFFTGGTPDRTMWLMLLAAPVAIPLLMLYGIGYWVGGSRQGNEIPWWCLGLLVAWLVCFAAIRAIAAVRRADYPPARRHHRRGFDVLPTSPPGGTTKPADTDSPHRD